MGLLAAANPPIHLVLQRDTVKHLRAGNPWVYRDSLAAAPQAAPGSLALVKTKDGTIVAKGFYDPGSPLAFRALAVKERRLDEALITARLTAAAALRQQLFDPTRTTGYRLVNGEGDGLPGLVVDVYGDTAVMKLDGAGPAGFYDGAGIAAWLVEQLGLARVWLKHRSGSSSRGRVLLGGDPPDRVHFLENGLAFAADVVQGQKTGFFLDQRDNRQRLAVFCKGRSVLNLFGYTGGFSIAAGAAGAAAVTTVDVAGGALADAEANWALNSLPPARHEVAQADCFDFLDQAAAGRQAWEVVVVDPPSFAPNKASVAAATASYEKLFAKAAAVTERGGILALASCSSHIAGPTFEGICRTALGRARRMGAVLGVAGQPADHPYPVACPELSYLKFVTHRLD